MNYRNQLIALIVAIAACGTYWKAYQNSVQRGLSIEIDPVARTKTFRTEEFYSLLRQTPPEWSAAVAMLFEPARRVELLMRPAVTPSPEPLTAEEIEEFLADTDEADVDEIEN